MKMATNSWPTRLWQRTSLMQRLALIAMLPTLITAALLVTLLTRHQLVNLRRMAQSNADTVAIQTASICVQPLRNQQLRELLSIADSVGELPHVTRVQIRTAAGQILADHRAPEDSHHPQEILTVMRDVVDRAPSGQTTVLGSVLVGVSLHEAIAAQIEDPFGTEDNDLALGVMSSFIEDAAHDLLGEPAIPVRAPTRQDFILD